MGNYAVRAVIETGHQRGSELLVLMALADIADDNGIGIMPDMEELGRKVNLTKSETEDIVSGFIGGRPFQELSWWTAGDWTLFQIGDVETYREFQQELTDAYVAGIRPPTPPELAPASQRTTLSYVKAVIPPAIRWAVWERDDFTCKHCGSRKNLSIDHIHPESKGGATELDNLQTLCKPCNSRKGDRLPEIVEE